MNLIRPVTCLLIATAALLFGGCATASQPAAMIATITSPVTRHSESVSVAVTGGSETSGMGASKISNADFAEAITSSIAQSGVFSRIMPAGSGDYALGVQIVRLDQPMFGLSFTVTLECTWRLTRQSDGRIVWEKSISTPFTASTSDAFAGTTRLRLANEGAARTNIEEAIKQLGALKLP